MIQCKNCGEYIEDSMKFCTECGSEVKYDEMIDSGNISISTEDGTVTLANNEIKRGMSFYQVESLRKKIKSNYPYRKTRNNTNILFPPLTEGEDKLWVEIVFFNEKVSEIDITVPFKNSVSPVPLSKENQMKILLNVIGKEFFDTVFKTNENGKMLWGNVMLIWNDNKCDGKLRLHIKYK